MLSEYVFFFHIKMNTHSWVHWVRGLLEREIIEIMLVSQAKMAVQLSYTWIFLWTTIAMSFATQGTKGKFHSKCVREAMAIGILRNQLLQHYHNTIYFAN